MSDANNTIPTTSASATILGKLGIAADSFAAPRTAASGNGAAVGAGSKVGRIEAERDAHGGKGKDKWIVLGRLPRLANGERRLTTAGNSAQDVYAIHCRCHKQGDAAAAAFLVSDPDSKSEAAKWFGIRVPSIYRYNGID